MAHVAALAANWLGASLPPCEQEEELTEAEKLFKAERGGGNYGAGTKEMQVG